jgi:hypothetical protein
LRFCTAARQHRFLLSVLELLVVHSCCSLYTQHQEECRWPPEHSASSQKASSTAW